MIEPIKVSRHRAVETNDQLTDAEVQSVQAVAGSINWLATQTRPDLSLAVSELVGILAHDKSVTRFKACQQGSQPNACVEKQPFDLPTLTV